MQFGTCDICGKEDTEVLLVTDGWPDANQLVCLSCQKDIQLEVDRIAGISRRQ